MSEQRGGKSSEYEEVSQKSRELAVGLLCGVLSCTRLFSSSWELQVYPLLSLITLWRAHSIAVGSLCESFLGEHPYLDFASPVYKIVHLYVRFSFLGSVFGTLLFSNWFFFVAHNLRLVGIFIDIPRVHKRTTVPTVTIWSLPYVAYF